MGRLRRARRHPGSIGQGAEAQPENSAAPIGLSHEWKPEDTSRSPIIPGEVRFPD
jgi:hypothetical protein